MVLGDTARLVVQRLNHDGEGVARLEDGLTVFIPGALPGEDVDVEITESKKKYARARLVKVLKASAERVALPCKSCGACGGCGLGHLSYEGQLAFKRQKVVDALERLGKFEVSAESEDPSSGLAVLVHPVIPSPDLKGYRNKLQLLASAGSGGGRLGFCRAGSNEVVDFVGCDLVSVTMNRIASRVTQLIRKESIPFREWPDSSRRFPPASAKPDASSATALPALRHVILREASGGCMVVLVVDDPERCLPDEGRLEDALVAVAAALGKEFPQVKCVAANLNSHPTSDLPFGPRTVPLWGAEHLTMEFGGLRFALSPTAFAQVNTMQTLSLYNKALEYAAPTAEDTVLDLYCGSGTISLMLARQAQKVVGIEVAPAAVRDAKKNAELNSLTNAEFMASPAESLLPRLVTKGIRPAVVVMDPPRQGCEPAVLEAVAAADPQRIVYVSCDPASLARDLARLRELGYKTVEVQPVDMFPQTPHVECVALVERS